MTCGRKDHWGSTLVSQSTYEVDYNVTPDSYLYGWVDDETGWVKLICNAAGKLIIDPSEILEEAPSQFEVGKAPTSNWAYTHKADANAHHSEYSIYPKPQYTWNEASTPRSYESGITLSFVRSDEGWVNYGNVITFNGREITQDGSVMQIYVPYSPAYGGEFAKIRFGKFDDQGWSEWQVLGPDVDGKIATHAGVANAHHVPPVAGDFSHNDLGGIGANDHHAHVIAEKSPDAYDYPAGISIFYIYDAVGWPVVHATIVTQWLDSGRNIQWCCDFHGREIHFRCHHLPGGWYAWRKVMTDLHEADAAAHHAKYTDAEAQTACKLSGTLYWSCAGIHFDGANPDTDEVSKNIGGYIQADSDGIVFVAGVFLPQRAIVTGVEVFGNAAAGFETWTLNRITLSAAARLTMGGENINTEDTSIESATINNTLYSYYLGTSSLDIGDRIHGARITYTL